MGYGGMMALVMAGENCDAFNSHDLEFFISSYKIYRSIKERSVLGIFIWYVLVRHMFISLKSTRRLIRESLCNVARLRC